MKKGILLIMLFSCILSLASCVMYNPNASNNVTVKKVEVTEYQKEVKLNEEFDEDSVYIKVTFSDNSKKTYCGEDLKFDYSDFDSSEVGKQVIKVTIKSLKKSVNLKVEVVPQSFKLLMIANSYGDDTVQWVHEICDNLGIEFTIANMYIGGCVLSTHLDNLRKNKPAYEYVSYNSTTKTWSRKANTSISDALELDDWTYISLQQGSHQSGQADTYDDIDAIMDEILELKDDVKFVWNMTWAYQQNSGHSNFGNYNSDQMTMYNAIVDAVKTKVATNDRFEVIVPNGTAIQNARTSSVGDNLCRDVYCHLTNDLGRYIAGLTMVGAVTGADISEVTYAPLSLSEEQRNIAIESAVNALKTPYSVTESQYKNENNDNQDPDDNETPEEKSFKLLMIANSYGDDTVKWVHEICADLGIDFTIANLYIGGCTLETHLNNLKNNSAAYEYVVYNKSSKTWSRQAGTSIATALASEDWNYISLQQGSHQSGQADTYNIVGQIMDEVLKLKNDVKFIWNMTWAYQQNSGHSNFGNYNNDQMTMYNAILNAVQSKIVPNNRFELIVPNGTAIQNARTSYIGDNLCRDKYCHLTNDFGRYIAGLTMVASVTGADISKINYAPVGVNEEYKKIAIESVVNALAKPFEVTNSKYPPEDEKPMDLSNYVKIDCELVGSAFWWSNNADYYNKLITNGGNSINFVASKRFTKDEIPVGSIIEIKNGYQYRPEGWVTDALQTTRPDNTTVKYVEVTEEWWGNYTLRAFNISSTAGTSLMYSQQAAMNAFSIYVPKDKYQAPNGNQYASGDATLFTNNGLNIADFEMYDYYVSNGFYNSATAATPLTINFYDKPEANNFCHKFLCTEGFDKSKLPVGSVIIVDSGYQYRPDGWLGNVTNPNRPGNVTTNFVVVDDAWWGSYTVKGFNISSTSGAVLNQNPYGEADHFRIYVPAN